MKKFISAFAVFFIFSTINFFSQETLKSTEEEYYDFLSLIGIVERPTLGYRTLSDSEWIFIEETNDNSENDDTTRDYPNHPWKDNFLGTKHVLLEGKDGQNWFTRGIDSSLKLKIYGPDWYNSFNSAAPYGQNDGALWQGRGYNTSLTAGLRLEAFGFEATIKPQLCFSQNMEFDYMTPNYSAVDSDGNPTIYANMASKYGYYGVKSIDAPQRFGDSPFWTYDWGDSEVRWTWHTFTMGFGTQSAWLGPAWINPMLGSNNAANYPKFDIGLRRTEIRLPWLNWYIGDIEGRIWCGQLSESDYFDNDADNDKRMINAMSASYSPSFIPGFTMGLNRIFLTNWAAHNLKYVLRLFTTETRNGSQEGDGEDEDQKVSLFIDWKFPKVGFEFYGELGIDDFTSQELANPFHTAIYTIGVKQFIPLAFSKLNNNLKDCNTELIFEWNNFEMSQDFQMQWTYGGYYNHGRISQGYTQKGQILGAGTGYSGNSQYVGYKIFFPRGYFMPFFHRHCPDNNYIYCMTVGKAVAYKSDVFNRYYGSFKTYRVIGGEFSYFITKSMLINSSLAVMFINFPQYNSDDVKGQMSYHGNFTLKYNF